MPIDYRGNRICEKCGKPFDWVHWDLARQNYNKSLYAVDDMPEEMRAHAFSKNDQGGYDVYVNCPHCGFDNIFTAPENEENEIRI